MRRRHLKGSVPQPRFRAGKRRNEKGSSNVPEHEPHADRAGARQIVFGVEPVKELLAAAPKSVRVLYVRERDQRRFSSEVESVRATGGEVRAVDDAVLARIAGRDARHQGIAAVAREYNYASLEELLEAKSDPLLIVDGVTDPRNLGAILRSAEGAGAPSVIVARDRTCPLTPAAIKSSAGAWAHLRIARCGNVARLLDDLKKTGYWVAALTPGGETSVYQLDTSRRLVLVVGSEGRGVRELIAKTADFRVAIPMRGKVGSLNVAAATAVALFEIARRRAATS